MSRYRRNPDGTFDKVAGSPYMPPNFIGASPSENGEAGLVPAPLAGDENKALFGDGSWRTPPGTESAINLPETPTGKYYKDDGTFDNVKNNGYVSNIVDSDTSIRSTDQVTIDPELNVASPSGPTNLAAIYSLFKDMLTNVWHTDYTEAQTYADFVEALYSGYDRIELQLHTSNLDLYGDGNEYPITVKMIGEYGKVNSAYPDTDYWKFQGTAHINDNDEYGFNGFDTLKMTIYVNPLDPELPDDLVVAVDNDGTTNYEITSEDDVCTKVFDVEIYNQDDYEDNGHWNYWNSSFDSTSQSLEFVGISSEEVYPTPTKYLREDGTWTEPPAGNGGSGISLPETPTGKVYQDDGTFGKKLQVDIVIQNGEYGYIGANDTFIPFKSQADIDAAVSAARVGNATAADVRKGKTFTNNSASGLIGTLVTEPFQVGRLSTRKNIDGWSDTWTTKTWSGLTNFNGSMIWTDGDNIYYSSDSTQYVLNKSTSTWSTKTWSGLTSFLGNRIWTDGNNIYYSMGFDRQYVLNKSTSTWSVKTWSGYDDLSGSDIWTDGTNIYYSSGSAQYVLDKSTSTWSVKTWNGATNLIGSRIWTDGDNIYYSNYETQYVLDKATSTWSTKTWDEGFKQEFVAENIWTDGITIHLSDNVVDYILNKSASKWDSYIIWKGLTEVSGQYIWTDGDNIYFSINSYQYVLNKVKTKWPV